MSISVSSVHVSGARPLALRNVPTAKHLPSGARPLALAAAAIPDSPSSYPRCAGRASWGSCWLAKKRNSRMIMSMDCASARHPLAAVSATVAEALAAALMAAAESNRILHCREKSMLSFPVGA